MRLFHCTFPPSIVISDLGFGHGLIVSRSNCRSMSEFASMPVRGSALAAGYDISASHACTIPARGKNLVKTDLQMAIPEGCYGRIAPRSGLAWKNFIDTGAGVIDADYRGEVKVMLFNHDDKDFEVKQGDRVAQLILERIATPEVVAVDDLDATERAAGGFGSTGVQGKPIDVVRSAL